MTFRWHALKVYLSRGFLLQNNYELMDLFSNKCQHIKVWDVPQIALSVHPEFTGGNMVALNTRQQKELAATIQEIVLTLIKTGKLITPIAHF